MSEDSIGDERVRVFPVRTFLSRMLMQDADCIVNIRSIWQMADGPNFVNSFVPSLKGFVPQLKYMRKERMTVRVRFAEGRSNLHRPMGQTTWSRAKSSARTLALLTPTISRRRVSDEDRQPGQRRKGRQCQTIPHDCRRNSESPASPPILIPNTIAGPGANTKRTPALLSYGDGKPDGKKSYGGSGHMIRFELPEGVTKVKGIRIHGSRYGLPQARTRTSRSRS